jgi:hypothetical protein
MREIEMKSLVMAVVASETQQSHRSRIARYVGLIQADSTANKSNLRGHVETGGAHTCSPSDSRQHSLHIITFFNSSCCPKPASWIILHNASSTLSSCLPSLNSIHAVVAPSHAAGPAFQDSLHHFLVVVSVVVAVDNLLFSLSGRMTSRH